MWGRAWGFASLPSAVTATHTDSQVPGDAWVDDSSCGQGPWDAETSCALSLASFADGSRASHASSRTHLLQASPSLSPAFPGHISQENTHSHPSALWGEPRTCPRGPTSLSGKDGFGAGCVVKKSCRKTLTLQNHRAWTVQPERTLLICPRVNSQNLRCDLI